MAANGRIEIGQITDTKDADIEDLFDRDFYLKLVSVAYAKEPPAPLTTVDINAADPQVVRAVETYFAPSNVADGKFDHYRPAVVPPCCRRPGRTQSTAARNCSSGSTHC